MRIVLRNESRQLKGEIEIDPARQPSRAKLTNEDREIFLNWNTAIDDAGQLRRCLSCGCRDMFREKVFPTAIYAIVVLNYAGLLTGIFGGAENVFVLGGMIVLLALGLVVLLMSRTRLVCYRCRTAYHDLPIARYHRSWDRSIADRHPPPAAAATQRTPQESFDFEEAESQVFEREESIA